jgi:protein-S-isoprenylcysteine O-methyltransferase Ste14
MSTAFLTLNILVFVYITILPRIFFRGDGKFNLMWWLTGFPLGLSPFAVVLQAKNLLPSGMVFPTSTLQEVLGTIICIAAFCLISFTIGTHRIPLSLWHQENDAPRQIVTWGAYKRIRHPFYSSFITALVGSVVAAPNVLTIIALIYGIAILNSTAAKEEQKLSASEYGQEYVDYMKGTGRFFPRI